MLEVPSLLWQLPALLRRVDFLSVGTQRPGPVPLRLRPRQSAPRRPLRPAVAGRCWRCSASGRGNAPRRAAAHVCGEMAGKPIEAMALIGLGFRALSMAPTAIGPVKTMIRSLDAGALARLLGEIAASPTMSAAPRAGSLCARSWRDTLGALWKLGIARRDCYRRPDLVRKLRRLTGRSRLATPSGLP